MYLAPKPICRGRVPRRPDSLAPLAAVAWITLCGDPWDASTDLRCLRASLQVGTTNQKHTVAQAGGKRVVTHTETHALQQQAAHTQTELSQSV